MATENGKIVCKAYDLVQSLLKVYGSLAILDKKAIDKHEELEDKVKKMNLEEITKHAEQFLPEILSGKYSAVYLTRTKIVTQNTTINNCEAFRSFVLACDFIAESIIHYFCLDLRLGYNPHNSYGVYTPLDRFISKDDKLELMEKVIEFILGYVGSLDVDIAWGHLVTINDFLKKLENFENAKFKFKLECYDYRDEENFEDIID